MNWLFYSLLLANLACMALNHSAQGAGRTENAGDILFKTSSSWASGSEREAARILSLSKARKSSNKLSGGVQLEQPILVAAGDEFNSCLGLGPFENVMAVQGVAKRLRDLGYTIEMTAVDTLTGRSDYRVVMPPLSSRREAFRRLRELKSRGIDSSVITKGLEVQGISLGVFASNELAENYRQELIGLGYEVLLDVLPRVNRGYWVQISQGVFPEKFLLDVSAEFIEVEVTETGCMN